MVNNIIISILALVLSGAIYCYLLAKLKNKVNYFRNWILLPATFLSGFVLYFIGFATCPDPDSVGVTTFKAIHATVMMILMESTINDISDLMRSNTLYMICFAISHFLGILLAVTTFLSLFGRRINANLRLITSFKKGCYVFFNTNEESFVLAEDILRNDHSRDVFFVGESGKQISEDDFDRIESMGAYNVDNSTSKNGIGGDLLFQNIISRESKLIYISTNEDQNISAALHLFSLLKGLSPEKRKDAEKNTSIYLQIDSEDMIQIFEEARSDMGMTIEYSTFSVPDIIAAQLVRNYSPSSYINADTTKAVAREDYEVMIVGFGRNGRTFLRSIIEYGQFVDSEFKATIVDQAINTKIGSFEANYPALMSEYNVETVHDSVGSPTFFKLLRERSRTLKQIIISLSNDSRNVKTAIEINKILAAEGRSNIDIIIVTSKSSNYLYLHNSNQFKPIRCIGQDSDIFTEDIIINESLLSRAKAVHDYYNSSKAPERRKAWRDLESIKLKSNISAASLISVKLELMGLSMERLREMSREEYLDYLKSDLKRYENLARTEHLRWNATYYTRGWQKWSLSDLPNNGVSQDHNRKLHVCLVSWEELLGVEAFFGGEPYQRYDYDNIDAIYDLVVNGVID